MSVKPLLCIALTCLAQGAMAQKMAPGLWENSVTMKTGSGQMESAMAQMQDQMAKMPPEQRKMLEDMMAKQGVGMAGGPGKATTLRVCISKEQAERAEVPQQQQGSCKQDIVARSGSTLKYKFTCTEPPSSGEGEFSFQGDKAYIGTLKMTSTTKGQAERMEMQQAGKWLGADCGTLKPRP